MRPGRFDRKVRMPKPDTNGRYEILQLHLRKKQVGEGEGEGEGEVRVKVQRIGSSPALMWPSAEARSR